MRGFSKRKLLSETAAICRVAEMERHVVKPFKLFRRADGAFDVINRETIDSGEVKKAGINVVDGDKLNEMEPKGSA